MKAYFEYEDDTFWAIRTNGRYCIIAEGNIYCDFLPERMLDMTTDEEHFSLRPKMKKVTFPDSETAEKESEIMIMEKRKNAIKQDSDFWYSKVKFCGNLLFFVPDEYITEELCNLANTTERKYKIGVYIPIHEEVMKQEWVTYGPLLEMTILSYIPLPVEWRRNRNMKNVSSSDIINNKIIFLKDCINIIKTLSTEIEIIDNTDRIFKEIDFLCKNELSFCDMRLNIFVGHKRNGRLIIHLVNKSSAEFKFLYLDDDDYKCRDEVKNLFDLLFDNLNGFCGTIGLESGLNDIFKMDELLIHMGDSKYYGIENVKWNTNFRRSINGLPG